MLDDDFENFKEKYDAAPVEVQQAITQIFDDEVFDDKVDAGIWLSVQQNDVLAVKYEQLQAILASEI